LEKETSLPILFPEEISPHYAKSKWMRKCQICHEKTLHFIHLYTYKCIQLNKTAHTVHYLSLSFTAQVLCKNFSVSSVNILASPICFFAHSWRVIFLETRIVLLKHLCIHTWIYKHEWQKSRQILTPCNGLNIAGVIVSPDTNTAIFWKVLLKKN
jgi:hypothetical protein